VELLLWRYLERGLSVGRALDGMLAHAEVLPVWKLARAVGREAHRYKGLVRFRELVDGSWYAAIEPEHRILPLIAHHFTARFADQRWIIHDMRRDTALIFDPAYRRPLLMDMAVTGPAPLAQRNTGSPSSGGATSTGSPSTSGTTRRSSASNSPSSTVGTWWSSRKSDVEDVLPSDGAAFSRKDCYPVRHLCRCGSSQHFSWSVWRSAPWCRCKPGGAPICRRRVVPAG